MTWISKLATAVGLVLLAHSCYSAQEFSSFQVLRASATSQPTLSTLPVDITIETIAALLITTLGLVLGTQQLKPIQWRVWAGKVEREGRDGPQSSSDEPGNNFIGNPFRFLESRPGFVDIRRQRKNFGDWARVGGESK
ncbi:transmembrane protein 32 [Ophiostoma piceae UAMH 11346]|uniref:Transmembrane protein 32 n=1 Tax=Ophiostoma piceae (strain UAMH 11346) TaxID=1262450 RepID=S3CVB7_OPHP1|nr:transmembrane protein 32 [Ophiostoma piceae UAMH 11346]